MGRAEGEALHIDNLLLSCRVIGRGVETAMLAYLCEAAAERGLAAVTGELIPTGKNVPVRKLFEENGFTRTAEDAAGTSLWRVSLPGEQVKWPEWFRIVRGAG
jgi:predicted enzyme involved in methoxymalonyl-ACP biosynthesis